MNYSDGEGTTPLHACAESGNLDCLHFLINQGVEVNRKDACMLTPLHLAAGGGHLECVNELINSKALMDEKDIWGWTPLHRAIINLHFEVGLGRLTLILLITKFFVSNLFY